jgi:trigger factor
MKTEVTELSDSRVRVAVEVDAHDVEHSIEHAAGHLAEDMRVPGFRKGKVPPAIVVQRAGREAVLDAALREFLPAWYEMALMRAAITPVGDPKLNVETLPAPGEPLEFSIEVSVRPRAKLGEYRGLEVGRADPEPPAEAVDAEIDRLREGFARLETVEREAREGDFVTIDYRGEIDGEAFEGGEATDYMVELGAGTLLEELEKGLTGASAGDERSVPVRFPDEYGAEQVAGKDAVFKVTVKDVREKHLPELDDDFASDASEFESLAELREEIARRVGEALERRADAEFRDAALDAAAEAAEVDLPEEVVQGRAQEMFERFERTLQRQGIGADAYLQMSGKTREEVIADSLPEATRSLRREATLEAVADAEGLEVSDDEMLEALTPGEDGDGDPAELMRKLQASGRDALLREELRMRKAADLIADAAKPIPIEQAAAREKIWTPDKEREQREGAQPEGEEKPGGLWTPGDGS